MTELQALHDFQRGELARLRCAAAGYREGTVVQVAQSSNTRVWVRAPGGGGLTFDVHHSDLERPDALQSTG